MTDYEVVIGLEVHAQLLTESKMFCACANDPSAGQPNTLICPICMGYPGTLPVINERAIRHTLLTALALHCQVADWAQFHRKNYTYPDLPKGYQISQYDQPLGRDGWVEIGDASDSRKRVRVRRVHVEEDTARLIHTEEGTLVDFNRAGLPLMEIVTEPDMASPEEARQCLQKLRTILRYLGVSTGNMEQGSLRLEPSVSLRPRGAPKRGTRVEIKNLNSFRSAVDALTQEVERQKRKLQAGERVVQQTVGWDEGRRQTVVQRVKETEDDYRYFPEPDLPPLVVSAAWLEELRTALPELPDEKARAYVETLGLSAYDAVVLTADREVAEWFEAVVAAGADPKLAANVITGPGFGLSRETGRPLWELDPAEFARLLEMAKLGVYSSTTTAQILRYTLQGQPLRELLQDRRFRQISAADQLAEVANSVLQENPQAVRDYLGGKETALQFLVGKVMRQTRGQANPQVARELLRETLERQR